jgi:hypothetical protein
MKQNITLSLDAATLRAAKALAAKRHQSVSRLLSEELAEQVAKDKRYAQAKRQALDWLANGLMNLGGQYISREEIHGRQKASARLR